MTKALHSSIFFYSQLLCENKQVLTEGQAINFTQLGYTLRVLADEGADSFYNGSISKKIIEDLHNEGLLSF